jgi:hypothetical protein
MHHRMGAASLDCGMHHRMGNSSLDGEIIIGWAIHHWMGDASLDGGIHANCRTKVRAAVRGPLLEMSGIEDRRNAFSD